MGYGKVNQTWTHQISTNGVVERNNCLPGDALRSLHLGNSQEKMRYGVAPDHVGLSQHTIFQDPENPNFPMLGGHHLVCHILFSEGQYTSMWVATQI